MENMQSAFVKRKPRSIYDHIADTPKISVNTSGTAYTHPIFVLDEDCSEESDDEEERKPTYEFIPPWRNESQQSAEIKSEERKFRYSQLQNKAERKADNLSVLLENDSTRPSKPYSADVDLSTGLKPVLSGFSAIGRSANGKAQSGSTSQYSSNNKENIYAGQASSTSKRTSSDYLVRGTPTHYRPQPLATSAIKNTSEIRVSHTPLKTEETISWKKEKLTRNVAVQTVKTDSKTLNTRQTVSADKQKSTSELPAVITVNNKLYTVLNLLGKGGSSKVEQVFDFESCRRLALKTVNLVNQPPQNVTAFKKEIEMLKKLQFSDRVINLIDFEYNADQLFLLLECGDTDLAVYLKKKMEEKGLHKMQRCIFWHEMLQAVHVLHEQGIVHSDIKPANFMLVAGEIKLIDFGIARQLDADATSMVLESCVGTLNYMSPEVLQGLGSKHVDSKAGRKADVWSLGCILYYMTYGITPFQSITAMIAKISAITSENHVINVPDVGEPHLANTIQLCLLRDYKKRASIEQLLSHPYIN